MQRKQLINRFRKSKDGKVLAENFVALSLLQLAGYLFPLITLPYLARVIGVDGFGKIAFAAAIMVWINTVVGWGFNYTATRDVARCREDIDKVSTIFSNVLWARLFLAFASLVVLVALIFIIPKFRENYLIILLTFLMIPGHIAFPEWFFQAMEKMKNITILNVLSKLVFTLLVFVVIRQAEDYVWQPLLTSCGFLVAGVIALYYIFRKWHIKLHRPNFSNIFATIKGSSDVFINNLMPNLYNSFSSILLGFWGGASANGLLDAGTKFTNLCKQLLDVVCRTFFPFLSRKIEKHSMFAKGNIFLSLVMALVLFFSAPLLIKIMFTEEFYPAITLLRIMSVSLVFSTLTLVYGTNYLIIVGKERLLRNITIISSLIGFVLTFPLIYFFGCLGAAITVTLTRGILGVCIMINALRFKSQSQRI